MIKEASERQDDGILLLVLALLLLFSLTTEAKMQLKKERRPGKSVNKICVEYL